MADPETTLPPRQPNTLRTWFPRIWAKVMAWPDWAKGLAAGALLGLLLPPLARLIF